MRLAPPSPPTRPSGGRPSAVSQILNDRSGMAKPKPALVAITVWGLTVVGTLFMIRLSAPAPAPAPTRLSPPVARITLTTKPEGLLGRCPAFNFQLKNAPLISLSQCNHPWIPAVRPGDRLIEQAKTVVGFVTGPVTRITPTTQAEGFSTCPALNFQFKSGPLISLSQCNHPWITAVRPGDRLEEHGGTVVGFAP